MTDWCSVFEGMISMRSILNHIKARQSSESPYCYVFQCCLPSSISQDQGPAPDTAKALAWTQEALKGKDARIVFDGEGERSSTHSRCGSLCEFLIVFVGSGAYLTGSFSYGEVHSIRRAPLLLPLDQNSSHEVY